MITLPSSLNSNSLLTIQVFREDDSAQLTEMKDILFAASQGHDIVFEVGYTQLDSNVVNVITTATSYKDALAALADVMDVSGIKKVAIEISFDESESRWAHIYCHYSEEDETESSFGTHVDSIPLEQFEILPLSELDYFQGTHMENAEEPYALWVETA